MTSGWSHGKILLEAHALINGPRQEAYGPPKECFERVAQLWATYLDLQDVGLDAYDVAVCLALLKLARDTHKRSNENMTDACGYLALAADLTE